MSLTRRNFVLGMSSGTLLGSLSAFTEYAHAAGPTDYKALVCVFLFGGNDGNNTVIPTDSSGYGKYAGVRGDHTTTAGALGIPQSQLIALPPATGSAQFGLHPDLAPLQSIWNSKNLALLFNVGTLVQPLTVADYKGTGKPRPGNLFSHLDQQNQMQTSISAGPAGSGWAGRIADALGAANGSSPIPVALSIGNASLFTDGLRTAPLTLPQSGSFGLSGFGGSYAGSVNSAYASLLQVDRQNLLVSAAQGITAGGIAASQTLNGIFSGTSSVSSLFAGQKSSLSLQLQRVARIIENRGSLGGVTRQVFFVSLGGFDTHSDQINRQSQLFQQLAPALKSFHDAMLQLGTDSQVTSFTLSDFARTLKPASGGGSDHAWGSHHFILGGAVKGQSFYGSFPDLTLGGPSDVSTEGRWLPTNSIDQYGATLARWFGVADADLPTVFPNLRNFATANLGFMG
ncbi:MAG: DUF1501 domain-containing protein [Nevskia sp.]